jgi:hypothetical protein
MAKTKYKEKEREKDRPERPDRPKAKNDAYVVMLLITFFAILAGCVMLYLDNEQYGSKSPQKEVVPPLGELGGKAPPPDAKGS